MPRARRGRTRASKRTLFGFAQFDVAGALGPVPGRYVVRRFAGEDAHRVLVVTELSAAPAWGPVRGRRERRVREAPPDPPPAELPATRATVIDTDPLDGASEGERWLTARLGTDGGEAAVAASLAELNRAIAAHRVAAADPYVRELDRAAPFAVRLGYGEGEDVANGRWEKALLIPVRSGRETAAGRRAERGAMLRPQERLAAILSGRDAVLSCEELTLRARLDVTLGREREAALQAHLAIEAALCELVAYTQSPGMRKRLDGLEERRDRLADAANAALQGGLDEPTAAAVRDAVDRLEAALRARAVGGAY